MTTILDKIIARKKKDVALKKGLIPVKQLEQSVLYEQKLPSLAAAIANTPTGIIAEFKRRSPSKSEINQQADIADVAKGYQNAGVSGMSVLTDGPFFGGSLDDLLLARAAVTMPLLRKEFIVDEYQIIEAKAHGAAAILLIAASLKSQEIQQFASLAKQLGMDVLCEAHNAAEVHKSIVPQVDMIGINNRNLKTFEVSLDTSKTLSTLIPDEFVKVSESGISTIDAISELLPYGYQGFLIGENFMKTKDPGASATQFIQSLLSRISS